MDTISPVTTTPGTATDTLALLEAPQAAAVVEKDTSAPAGSDAAPAAAGSNKGGRPRTAPRDASGKVIRTRNRSGGGGGKQFTRADAKAATSSTSEKPALTGDVKDGPAPGTVEARPPRVPTPEEIAAVAPLAQLALVSLSNGAAAMRKNPKYKLTADELATMPEAVARFYIWKYPDGIDQSPGAMLLLVVAMYAARVFTPEAAQPAASTQPAPAHAAG